MSLETANSAGQHPAEEVLHPCVGGGASCAARASDGVHICQPASGSTIGSPAAIQAAATISGKLSQMELWVERTQRYSEAVAAGSHRFAVLALNATGTKWEQVVSATVN